MFQDDYSRGSHRKAKTTKTKGEDIVLQMEIDFMEAVKGCEKTVGFSRNDVCLTCKG